MLYMLTSFSFYFYKKKYFNIYTAIFSSLCNPKDSSKCCACKMATILQSQNYFANVNVPSVQ